MIDPVDAILVEMALQAGIEAMCAGEILAERLLDHDAVAIGCGGQPGTVQPLDHDRKFCGRNREVKHAVGAAAAA